MSNNQNQTVWERYRPVISPKVAISSIIIIQVGLWLLPFAMPWPIRWLPALIIGGVIVLILIAAIAIGFGKEKRYGGR